MPYGRVSFCDISGKTCHRHGIAYVCKQLNLDDDRSSLITDAIEVPDGFDKMNIHRTD